MNTPRRNQGKTIEELLQNIKSCSSIEIFQEIYIDSVTKSNIELLYYLTATNPLNLAVEDKKINVIHFLISIGVDITDYIFDIISIATYYDDVNLLSFVLEKTDAKERKNLLLYAMNEAIKNGSIDSIKKCMELGFTSEYIIENLDILKLAARIHIDILVLLLEYENCIEKIETPIITELLRTLDILDRTGKNILITKFNLKEEERCILS